MSGAAREGMDLLHRFGRRHFWRQLSRGRFNRYVWRDTFGRVLCWLSGEHIAIKQSFEYNGECETHCQCCCKWLKQEGYKWVTK